MGIVLLLGAVIAGLTACLAFGLIGMLVLKEPVNKSDRFIRCGLPAGGIAFLLAFIFIWAEFAKNHP
jgi:hypothetical protein